jgi:hypothetical protein
MSGVSRAMGVLAIVLALIAISEGLRNVAHAIREHNCAAAQVE